MCDAFHRHAYFSKNKYKEAIEAYEKGLSLDPNNTTMKKALANAEQKASELGQGSRGVNSGSRAPSAGLGGLGGLGNLANLAGLGGAGEGGAGLDFGNLMSNPAIMNMASQMMRSGAFNDLLNNPNLASMLVCLLRSLRFIYH